MIQTTIKPKDRDAVLQALKAGVVPRVGVQHIQVGRASEIESLIADIQRVTDSGSGMRFIIGEYGAGKTFFLQLVRNVALEKGLVTAHADLNPQRRLNASGGEARSLYTELTRNISTRSKPDGSALPSIVERFVSTSLSEARDTGVGVKSIIDQRLGSLSEMVGGFDFAAVIAKYWEGHDNGNEELKQNAVRWLRGEFTTKTDAKAALAVRTIVDDDNMYDMLKLLARFVRLAGYSGLLVGIDEMVNLYKIGNSKSRTANYEQILRYYNDCLQGASEGILFLMAGTPEFLLDARKGLYSYAALASRLAENTFARSAGVVDYSSPVIRLPNLSPEDIYVLLSNLIRVFYSSSAGGAPLPEEAIKAFMEHCSKRIGDAYFRTPRNTVKSFIDLMYVLDSNPSLKWQDLLGQVTIEKDVPSEIQADDQTEQLKTEDELTSLKI